MLNKEEKQRKTGKGGGSNRDALLSMLPPFADPSSSPLCAKKRLEQKIGRRKLARTCRC
jgi:hypothetical protein